MALICSQYNTCSDWLIPKHYSSIMPTGRLGAAKTKKGTDKLLLFPEDCSSFKRCETRNILRMNPGTLTSLNFKRKANPQFMLSKSCC